ncbi:hypothetical protein PR003_g4468 [Phytophthora rubi]|uniref:Uncharacterized protein n=1 Tax=Phytophthora rubi TaxID=129364 RepID=A0A6A3N1S4_9STRA|nr:hypothetical protein PR002_g6223 [Phytophthora rubi]KAE9352266.1 hypothetical protein PR003_g4468 [Phytophthora rubi]
MICTSGYSILVYSSLSTNSTVWIRSKINMMNNSLVSTNRGRN